MGRAAVPAWTTTAMDGPWIGEQMRSPLRNPLQYARYRRLSQCELRPPRGRRRQSCIPRPPPLMSSRRRTRLSPDAARLRPGPRRRRAGPVRRRARSTSRTPMPARVAVRYPNEIEWAASVHPYRADAVEALDAAVAGGARAVKWLPNAMGIDPASPRCDPFYRALARRRIPLLTHGGRERAVRGTGDDTLGNPLRVRRALDHGGPGHRRALRIVRSRCRSRRRPRWSGRAQRRSLRETDGRPPLRASPPGRRLRPDPGEPFPPAHSARSWNAPTGTIACSTAPTIPCPAFRPCSTSTKWPVSASWRRRPCRCSKRSRTTTPLLFDFVLKRTVSRHGARFSPRVFETARHLDPPTRPPAGQ